MTSNATPIADLSDPDAIRILALVLDYDRALPDPAWLRDLDSRAREAVIDPNLAELAYLGPVTAGGLARETLTYLTDTRPELASVVEHAAALPAENKSRVDPGMFAIGALVLLALQTEVEVNRSEKGRWRFRFHKKPMADSTLGQLIGRLITYLLPPP